MILATFRDGVYLFFLFLHIVAVLVSFAPAFINPLLDRHFEKNGGDAVLQNWYGFSSTYAQRIALPGLVVVLVTGILMILTSDSVIEFSDAWISGAFVVWLAITGVVSGMILKGEKAVAGGDMSGRKLVENGGKIATLLLFVMLILMIWKPGA